MATDDRYTNQTAASPKSSIRLREILVPIATFLAGCAFVMFSPYLTRVNVSCSLASLPTTYSFIVDNTEYNLEVFELQVLADAKPWTWHVIQAVDAQMSFQWEEGIYSTTNLCWSSGEYTRTMLLNPRQTAYLLPYAYDWSGNTYCISLSHDQSTLFAHKAPLIGKQIVVKLTGDGMQPCTFTFHVNLDGTPTAD